MGLFAKLLWNTLFSKTMEEVNENKKEYDKMSNEELLALDDADFVEFLIEILNDNDFPNFMTKEAATVLTAMVYEIEVNNGGIDQFFCNSSRMFGPYVSEAFGIIGATQHKKLFDDFVVRTGADLAFLAIPEEEEETEISIKQEEFCEEQADIFEEFDNNFYEMEKSETIEELYLAYAREHIDRLR